MQNLREEYSFFDKYKVWFNHKLIVVFTVGKVGTLTVCASLEKAGFRHIHPHSLYFTWPGIYFLKVDMGMLKRCLYVSRTIFKRIKITIWKSCTPKIKIISGVRDPFSRSISAYFEQVHYNGGIPSDWGFEDIKKDFEARVDFLAQDRWFMQEFIKFTGIDIYDMPFDNAKGYCELKNGKMNALVYRIDFLNRLSPALSDFCGDRVDLINANDSSDNEVGSIYSAFKKRYRFPKSLAMTILESKSFNHFYNKNERKVIFEMHVEP